MQKDILKRHIVTFACGMIYRDKRYIVHTTKSANNLQSFLEIIFSTESDLAIGQNK